MHSVTMVMVVLGGMCVQSIMTIHTIIRLQYWYKFLRLFNIGTMAIVVMGDACSKYHGHTHYTMLVIVINCLRLFAVVILMLPL